MTDYSLEPPRKDLHLHHTYDALEDRSNRVLDTSPQGNDGAIIGNVEVRVPGIDGDAVRFTGDQNAVVDINDTFGDQSAVTVTTWVNFEEPAEDDEARWTLTLDSSDKQITWSYPSALTGWHYFVGWYDGDEMRIYHGDEGAKPELVASRAESGTVNSDFALEIDMAFSARVDDTRVYTTDLSYNQMENIWTMATMHVLSEEVGDAWPTPGLPYDEGEGNERFGATLAEKSAWVERVLDQVREARHIDDAAGAQLNRIGNLLGVRRRDGENDGPYRARIKGTAIAGRSAGTFQDILDGMVAILDTSKDRIELDRDDNAIAEAEITVQATDLDGSPITASDLLSIAEDLVLAGHSVAIVQSDENAFTVKADGATDDADLGLTSDSISTGGTLVEDIS